MNRVGEGGKGESVWLGWMLHNALDDFARIADARGERARAAEWRAHIAALKSALESQAWDGQWYRRGWFDDGTPLGSAQNEECRIDSIAQSWAVMSGAAQPERASQAMAAVDRELILPHEGWRCYSRRPSIGRRSIQATSRDIRPGVRENGGQYTHAALWSVMAFASLGEGDKAAALFWMLNPINHARTRADMHRYKVEPYVVAADVYSATVMSDAADGHGTRVRRDGCNALASKAYLDFESKTAGCASTLAFQVLARVRGHASPRRVAARDRS